MKSPLTTESLTVDGRVFEIRRSARRRRVELIVERDGALVLAIPRGAETPSLEAFVGAKRLWLDAKLATRRALGPKAAHKEFVRGEGFLFQGRSHRLLLVDAQEAPLTLEGGHFRLVRSEAPRGREHFVRWYAAQALPWLVERVRQWTPRLDVAPAEVTVRDLGFRWGLCTRPGRVSFHWATAALPTTVAEYIVVHELVHLHEPNHGARFWARIARAMPDWNERKTWLTTHGAEHLAL